MKLDDMVVRSHPGDGVVGRFPGVAIVLVASSPRHDAAVDQLLTMAEAASASGATPGRRLARQVAGLLSSADPDDLPAIGLVAQTDTGMALILQGAMDADVSSDQGQEHLSGASVATWVDHIFPATVTSLVVAPTGKASNPDPRTRLGAGVVSGAGLSAVAVGGAAVAPPPSLTPPAVEAAPPPPPPPPAPPPPPPPPVVDVPLPPPAVEPVAPVVAEMLPPVAEPGPAEWPPPAAESLLPPPESADLLVPTEAAAAAPPAPAPVAAQAETPADFVSVPLGPFVPEADEVRPPLPIAGEAAIPEQPTGPQVRGVICSRGHFNDPSAPFCGVCGISMVQRTLNLVEGPRPPLGIIVFDDGTTFTLDTDYVLGREPENDPKVVSGEARPLAMEDPDRTVSRVHAGLLLDGWNVKAVDRGSANGTFIAGPGDDNWIPLIPNQPIAIKPGTRIRLGQRVFLYDSHQGTR